MIKRFEFGEGGFKIVSDRETADGDEIVLAVGAFHPLPDGGVSLNMKAITHDPNEVYAMLEHLHQVLQYVEDPELLEQDLAA